MRSNVLMLKCSDKKMTFRFENLEVYQKAVAFAIEVSEITDTFPKGSYYLTDQINRAAISISLNLAEGNGRFTQKDRNNFFYIARGSAFECVPLLKILNAKKRINEEQYNRLMTEIETISKMLSGLMSTEILRP